MIFLKYCINYNNCVLKKNIFKVYDLIKKKNDFKNMILKNSKINF